MLRNRRLTVLLCLALPLTLWALTGAGGPSSSTNALVAGQVRWLPALPKLYGFSTESKSVRRHLPVHFSAGQSSWRQPPVYFCGKLS